MSIKRKIENLKDISEEIDSTEVHFGVEMLSPVKKARSGVEYYNGQVTDGSSTVRLVGFDATSQTKLSEFAKQKIPIKATNCAIRRNRNNHLEIHVNKGTTFTMSPRKLDFKYADDQQLASLVSISDIRKTADGIFVNLQARITRVAPAKTVTANVVQEIELQDDTGIMTMSVWNNNVDKLCESTSYCFSKLLVRTYHNEKILSFTNTSSYVEADQSEHPTQFPVNDQQIANSVCQLVGIQAFNIHYWCIRCSMKLTAVDDTLARCTSCATLQFASACKCQITSTLVFNKTESDPDATSSLSLCASSNIFLKILNMVYPQFSQVITPETDKEVLQDCRTKTFYVSHTEDIIIDINEQ